MDIYIARADQQSGPFSEEQIKSMLKTGMVGLGDHAWHDELEDWKPLHTVLKLPPPTKPQFAPASPVGDQIHFAAPVVRASLAHSGQPASFLSRLAAHVIDYLLTAFAGTIASITVWLLFLSTGPDDTAGDHPNFLSLAFSITGWLYFALMESSPKQATLGKMALRLIVTDLNGERVTFGRASGRYWGMILSAFTLGIGFFMCGWTQKRQCLHDILSGCLVLKKS